MSKIFAGIVYLSKKDKGKWDAVPYSWLMSGDQYVQYPPTVSEGIDAVAKMLKPQRDWPVYPVEVRCRSGMYALLLVS